MGVEINMSGVKISGDAKVLNDMKVRKKGKVDVDIKDSDINGNSQVLNDLSTEGELKYSASNVNIGENATIMSHREIREDETVTISQDDLKYTQTTKTAQSEQNSSKMLKKEGLLSKIAKIFNKKVAQSETIIDDEISSDYGKAYTDFSNRISGNGEYRKSKYSQLNIKDDKQDKTEEEIKEEDFIEK